MSERKTVILGSASRYVIFDLETSELAPEGDRPIAGANLGIACAATLTSDDNLLLWHGAEERGEDGRLPDRMTPNECQALAEYLLRMAKDGYTLITWNGLSFDLQVLAEECQDEMMYDLLIDLALGHRDIAFHMLCDKGFMVGMDAAAQGMNVEGKTEGMHGDLAPEMWKRSRADQDEVLQYVAQDVRATVAVRDSYYARGGLRWITKTGQMCKYPWKPASRRFLTVREAMDLPLPDTSWMDKPWSRERFYGWTHGNPFKFNGTFDELVRDLAWARAAEAGARAEVRRLEEELALTDLGSELVDARIALEEARDGERLADDLLRTTALEAYEQCHNKHPHDAVELREFTILGYDQAAAVAEAARRGWLDALKLEKRGFERHARELLAARAALDGLPIGEGEQVEIAKILGLSFVIERTEVRPYIASDLTAYAIGEVEKVEEVAEEELEPMLF